MATVRRGRPPAQEIVEPEILDYSEIDEIEAALSQLPEGEQETFIYVFRMHEQGRPRFLDKLQPNEFDLMEIKRTYGGGRYMIKAKSGSQTLHSSRFEIEGEPLTEEFKANKVQDAHGRWVYASKGNNTDDLPSGNSIGERLTRLEMLLERNLSQPQSQPVLEAIGTFLPLLINKLGGSEEHMLSKLTAYKNLFGSSNSVDPSPLINIFKEGLNLGSTSGGGVDNATAIANAVEKFAPIVIGMLGKANGARTPQSQPNMIPSSEPIMNNPQPLPEMPVAIVQTLAANLKILMSAASMDQNPELCVDSFIFPNIPDPEKEPLINWLSSPRWFHDLASVDNAVASHIEWFTELRDVLLAKLKGEPIPSGEDEPVVLELGKKVKDE